MAFPQHLQHSSQLPLYSHPEESEDESEEEDSDVEIVDIQHAHTYNVSDSSHPPRLPTPQHNPHPHPHPHPHTPPSDNTATKSHNNNSSPAEQSHTPPQVPSLIVRDRAFSNLSTTSSTTSSSPVKRKPLPVNASPLATRYSTGEHLLSPLVPPEETFSRPYSVDSPTLYEFPLTSTKPFSPSGPPGNKPQRYTLDPA